jgi:hypothetical protein
MDSLTLLKPKNLQLFVMMTIKSIVEAYELYFGYFWWMIILAIAWSALRNYAIESVYAISRILAYQSQGWLYGFLLLAVCFCTRPSMMKKDGAYFYEQYKKNIFYWLLMMYLPKALLAYIFPLHILFILFFAESEGSLKSCLLSFWYGLKMIVFNLPLFTIIGIIVYSLSVKLFLFVLPFVSFLPYINYPDWSYGLMQDTITALLLPISVCIYTNIYIKKLHDQFDLYFNKEQ